MELSPKLELWIVGVTIELLNAQLVPEKSGHQGAHTRHQNVQPELGILVLIQADSHVSRYT